MNIQEQINIANNLRNTIEGLTEHLSHIWYATEEDDLDCPYQVVSRFSGNWHLRSFYQHNEHYLTTHWDYSEPWEDYEDEDTLEIPVEWLQWYIDGELGKISKAFLDLCKEYSDKLEQEEISKRKASLEYLVDELGKEAVLDMLYGIEEVSNG